MTTASASPRRDNGPAPSMDDILAQIRRTLSDAVEPVATSAPPPVPPTMLAGPPNDARDERRDHVGHGVGHEPVTSASPVVPPVNAPSDDLSDLVEIDEPTTAPAAPASTAVEQATTVTVSQPMPPAPAPEDARTVLPADVPPAIVAPPPAPPAGPARHAIDSAAAAAASLAGEAATIAPRAPASDAAPLRSAEPVPVVVPPPRGLLSIRELAVNRLDGPGTHSVVGLTVPSHIGARLPEPTQQPTVATADARAPVVVAPTAAPASAGLGALGALEASLAAGGLVANAPPPVADAPAHLDCVPLDIAPMEPVAPAPPAVAPFVVPAGLEDGIVEALRPALRAWLDETVPRLAEEAARAASATRET